MLFFVALALWLPLLVMAFPLVVVVDSGVVAVVHVVDVVNVVVAMVCCCLRCVLLLVVCKLL